MTALSMLGLGLLPKRTLLGAGVVAAVMGAALVERQCTVMAVRADLGKAKAALESTKKDLADCNQVVGGLKSINEQLAAAAQRQNEAVRGWLEAAGAREQAAQKAAIEAEQKLAGERAKVAWLTTMAGKKADVVRPGECEAAAAVRVVREGLAN